MRNKANSINIDNSDPLKYPNGRIKDNSGANDGTPVNEFMYGDIHEFKDKLARLAGITPNGLPDNETNGYQLIDALRDFGSKHDEVHIITSVSGILNVSAKLATMRINESLLCKSAVNYTTETQVKSIDNSTYTAILLGDFKANEYVRVVKTASGILLIRQVDYFNLDTAVNELLYLKKATQAEENSGTIDTKGTTPLSNKTAFALRVNGADSSSYLANATRNGIYPKEHFDIVANLVSPIKNKGWIGGLDVSGTVGSLTVNGDILSATATIGGNDSFVTCTMANAMNNTNYLVKLYIESTGNIQFDNDIACPVYKVISTTQFQIGLLENPAGAFQNIKIHIEVQQL